MTGRTTELLLVRHGETVWHAENRYAGRSDVGLTERGRAQAGRLAAWANGAPPDRLVCSPLSRARDTARPVAAATGLDIVTDPRLVEVDFGRAEGLNREEMAQRYPDALAAFLERPATCPLPDGEAGADAIARATPALAQACDGAGRVLVVAHQTLLRLVLCAALRIDPDRYREVFPRLDSVAVTTLRVPPPHGPAWPRPSGLLGLNVRV